MQCYVVLRATKEAAACLTSVCMHNSEPTICFCTPWTKMKVCSDGLSNQMNKIRKQDLCNEDDKPRDLLHDLSLSPVTLNWPSSRVQCMFLILRDWFWQPLQRTKVRGIRYIQPAVYDHWPFNRLGSLKLLVDPPVDLFLMRCDFFSSSKAPLFIFFLLRGWNPSEAMASLKSPTSGLAGKYSSIKSWLHQLCWID